jgi:hypothetical protein
MTGDEKEYREDSPPVEREEQDQWRIVLAPVERGAGCAAANGKKREDLQGKDGERKGTADSCLARG